MTGEEWVSVIGGAVAVVSGMVSVAMRAWSEGNAPPPARKPLPAAPIEPPLTPHIGGYRTSPRPQAMAPRRAPWWRLSWWWVRGGSRKLEAARRRRDPSRETLQQIERTKRKIADIGRMLDMARPPNMPIVLEARGVEVVRGAEAAHGRLASSVYFDRPRSEFVVFDLGVERRYVERRYDVRAIAFLEASRTFRCHECGARPGEPCT